MTSVESALPFWPDDAWRFVGVDILLMLILQSYQ